MGRRMDGWSGAHTEEHSRPGLGQRAAEEEADGRSCGPRWESNGSLAIIRAVLPLLRSLRPTQWVKNLFVLLPLVFAGALLEPSLLVRGIVAFVLFCGLSSSIYLINDLLDRDKDRRHPVKRYRPLAAGTLSPNLAVAAAVVLSATAFAAAWWLGPGPFAIACLYVGQNLLYSFWLKHVVIVDILVISLGFVLRVMMGGAALPVPVSDWLLLCTIFLSLFLAVSKRRHEVVLLEERAADQRQVLERYGEPFLDQMTSVVTAATLLAYSLYATTHGSADLAPRLGDRLAGSSIGPEPGFPLVYTVPFVIFGIFRYLYLVYQIGTDRSPTEAMLTDAPFVTNLALWGAAILASFYL